MNKKVIFKTFLFILILLILALISIQPQNKIVKYLANDANIKASNLEIFYNLIFPDISADLNVSNKYIDTSEYTDEYIAYLNMSEEEKAKVSVVPDKYKIKSELLDNKYIKSLYDNNQNNENGINTLSASQSSSTNNTSFDLRNMIGSLNVENQGSTNLCWAYAANKCLETNIKILRNQTLNFSETYLDYITSNSVYGYRREIGKGGKPEDAFDIMSVKGATTESIIPNGTNYNNNFNAIKQAECSTRITQYILFSYVDKNSSDYDKQNLKDSVKSHITKYGSVIARINSPMNSLGYNPNTYAFCSSTAQCNTYSHVVNIIGWDDNFSKDNFTTSGSNKPLNNGAWLAVNSWGSNWGNDGCFWISYEDPHVNQYMKGIISSVDAHPYPSGYTINTYYPNNSFTLKPGNVISDLKSGVLTIQFDRKSTGKEYIDYIAICATGQSYAYINTENNSLSGNYTTIGYKTSNYINTKNWLIYNSSASSSQVLTGDSFAIKLKYRPYSNQTEGYGLYSADNIGGKTYLLSNNEWIATNYNPQVVVFTHSYPVNYISVNTLPQISYFLGEQLNTSTGNIRVTYADGTSEIIPLSSCTLTGYNSSRTGIQTVTVSYQGKITSFNVDVKEINLNSISIKSRPNKTSYFVGDTLDTTGLALTGVNNNGSTFTITSGFTCSKSLLDKPGTQAITVSYQGKITSFNVDVKELSIETTTYEIDSKYINKVMPKTTVIEFLKNIDVNTIDIKIINNDSELESTDLIATGCKIILNNKIYYTLIVSGDVDGNGEVNFNDILQINKHRLNKIKLQDDYIKASDINSDGKVDFNDILQINKYRLGKTNILN